MQRQLSIRSNEACKLAEKLARERRSTKAETVVTALKLLDRQPVATAPPVMSPAMQKLMQIADRMAPNVPPGLSSDIDTLHDEFGLPK